MAEQDWTPTKVT
jgi:hypothetical protein